MKTDILSQSVGFDWDVHNIEKIKSRHDVAPSECEQVFFNLPLVIGDDVSHSDDENRFYTLGQTDAERLLFLVFTVRKDKIRVISARNMSRRERRLYQEHEKENTSVQK
jgi:uncharacterized protein